MKLLLRRSVGRALRCLLIALAAIVPGISPSSTRAATPALLLAPDRGQYQGDCTGEAAGVAMALGRDFPNGAGIVLYAMRAEGLPFEQGNIQTLLATVVVREGRFVASNLGLRTLLCGLRDSYPDGARIEIVAALATNFDDLDRRDGVALARAVFTVDARAPLPATQRCFSETLLCVRDRFHDYWATTGGLARHGYPLTDERRELLEDGTAYTVQYFERSRLEYHPGNTPPNDIVLGQFGRRILATVPGAPTARATPLPGQTYFDVTGHNVAPDFAAYWAAHGALAGFGYPLSEEFDEFIQTGAPGEGRVYRVQYFERARFERHPENAPPYDILLGQFGRRILDEARRLATPEGVPAIRPTRPNAPPNEPTYSEDDVRAYLAQRGLPLGKMVAKGPYTVERIEFLPENEANRRLGLSGGAPSDRPICLVTVRGEFSVSGPAPGGGASVATFSTVIVIFDGRTGNVLGSNGWP